MTYRNKCLEVPMSTDFYVHTQTNTRSPSILNTAGGGCEEKSITMVSILTLSIPSE